VRILGHIHTFNDEDVIERSVQALLEQTHPLDEVLVVDNASQDGTLDRRFPPPVTVIRHSENRGTSGAVITGFEYALGKGYDWIWIFDADTAPEKDALEKLLGLYHSFPLPLQAQTWLLGGVHVEPSLEIPPYGAIFTRRGQIAVRPDPHHAARELHATIWSGSLYRLPLVRRLGLPTANYVLDWGEYEYGYRGMRAGYRSFLHSASIVHHNIGGRAALHYTAYRWGPLTVRLKELPPIRCYYLVRNLLHFWLYRYHVWTVHTLTGCALNVVKITTHFLLRPRTHRRELRACLRGIRDGLGNALERRY